MTPAVLDGRYRVDHVLARGGMSTVYQGLDLRLDRPVAVKVMDQRLATDPAFRQRFEREARAAARLHHPGVVAVHDQGTDVDGTVFLVLELVRGGTLRDLLGQRGRLEAPVALAVLEPLLAALAAAHHAGLVHRDVKPENVLIGAGGVVKVADFGLVRAAAEASTTVNGVILGTAAYLSPEQVATGAADARSDVYAVGVVLYEMLTGTAPYTGDSMLSVVFRHVNDDVPPPGDRLPGLPAPLDALVLRATRRDPAARPRDAAAFLQALRRVRSELRIPSAPVPVPEPPAESPAWSVSGQGPRRVQDEAPHQARRGSDTRVITGDAPTLDPPPAASPVLAQRWAHARRRARRTVAVCTLVVLVLAALTGYAAWRLGSG